MNLFLIPLADHFAAIGPCMEQWAADGTVESDCATAEVDDTVDLNNGATDSVLNYICSHIGDDGIPWDTELWGTLPAQQANSDIPPSEYGSTYVGPIPVFSADPAYCTGSGGAWNETVPIDYFVWGVLYDVVRTGGSANKSVYLRIDLDSVYDVGSWPGGADDNHGVVAEAPSFLVR